MMERGKPIFSRQTVLAAIDLLERLTQAEFTRCVLKWGAPYIDQVGRENISLTKRLNNLVILLDANPHAKADDKCFLRDVVVDEAAARFALPQDFGEEMTIKQEVFHRYLLLDGTTMSDGMIRRRIPADLRAGDAANDVTYLLQKHGFSIAYGHLQQAMEAHKRGNWAAANSQIRSFLEGLLDELAIKIHPAAAAFPNSENRRSRLATDGFLFVHLNEWSNDGKNYINGLMKRLHPHGSHPGLSDEEDSTFRLQIVVLTGRLLLARFDAGRP